MMGKEINPMEITAAATTPVVAGNRDTAPHRAEHLTDCFQQIFCHAGSLKNDPHEGEEGNRQKRVVLHDSKDAQWQGLEHRSRKQTCLHTDKSKTKAARRQRKRHGEARQQQHEQADEHERHKLLCQE
jgi:hypothetical protein